MPDIPEVLQYRFDSSVAFIKLSSPESGNTLTKALLDELSGCVERSRDNRECRAIAISAAGSDFCLGMDWNTARAANSADAADSIRRFAGCLTLIAGAAQPVIACVEGRVAGGGLGLVAACDIVIASKDAVFTMPEVVTGMVPAIITPFLLRRMTMGHIRYMALSSKTLTAAEALGLGLVDEVSENAEAALNLQLGRLLRSSPAAIASAKEYFDRLSAEELQRQTETAVEQLTSWLSKPEVARGIEAFADGFAPPWFQGFKRRKDGD